MLTEESTQMKTLSPESLSGSPVSIYLCVKDVDAIFNQAVSEGATVLGPIRDQFYGDRSGYLRSIWASLVNSHKKDLSPDELKKAGETYMKEMSKTK